MRAPGNQVGAISDQRRDGVCHMYVWRDQVNCVATTNEAGCPKKSRPQDPSETGGGDEINVNIVKINKLPS